MGSDVGSNPELCEKYCKAVRRATSLPFMAKMTPNITDMCEPAYASILGGANGISAINTIKSIINVDLDHHVGLPIIDGKSSISGYSGKAVKPVALRFIQQMRTDPRLKDVEISGIGGVETWEDAAEFILLGAKNIQVTTAIMQYGYRIIDDLTNGLMHYMQKEGVDSLEELVGLANKNIIPAEELNRDYKVYPSIDYDKCIGCGRCEISCYDGAHQAMEWDSEKRRPSCNLEKCVGCLLCGLVCPVNAITLGKRELKPNRKPKNLERMVLQSSLEKL
jgi:dihydropyrimidine dehydrogenase (NAD+) subunit PreA